MKIGIFGDSYGDRTPGGEGLAWWEMLIKDYKMDVTCHAVGGSSIYFSYKNFLKYQSNYDKVIFLVTNPSRLLIPVPNDIEELDPRAKHITNVYSLESLIEYNNYHENIYLKKLNEAIHLYYSYIQDQEKDVIFSNLMINHIKESRPDALIIPVADPRSVPGWTTHSLWDVSKIDLDHYGLDYKDPNSKVFYADRRHCHLTQENNFIFSRMIREWIDTGVLNFDITKFVTSKQPVSYYFDL